MHHHQFLTATLICTHCSAASLFLTYKLKSLKIFLQTSSLTLSYKLIISQDSHVSLRLGKMA